jgi:hypothetical protein
MCSLILSMQQLVSGLWISAWITFSSWLTTALVSRTSLSSMQLVEALALVLVLSSLGVFLMTMARNPSFEKLILYFFQYVCELISTVENDNGFIGGMYSKSNGCNPKINDNEFSKQNGNEIALGESGNRVVVDEESDSNYLKSTFTIFCFWLCLFSMVF